MGKGKNKSKGRPPTVAPRSGSSIEGEPKCKRERRNSSSSSSDSSSLVPQVPPKLWKRFYEPLVLLAAYGKTQGPQIKLTSTEAEGPWHDDNRELRKQFLDQLAYICDYMRGGDTVTAIAVEDGPQLKYWIAANTNQGPKIKPLVSDILERLKNAFGISDSEARILQSEISDTIISFCSKRLEYYKKELSTPIRWCLKRLETQDTEDAKKLKEWLSSLCQPDLDLKTLIQLCYDARVSGMTQAIAVRAEDMKRQQMSPSGGKYGEIRHLVGRLGSHIKAAGVLVEAGRRDPQLFTNYSVEVGACHPIFKSPTHRNDPIDLIIRRMISDHSLCKFYQSEINSQNEKFNLDLEKRIKQVYEDRSFKLRLHAEIIILDHFYRNDLPFLGGERYIGVSKPSCFLCYRYLQAHPMRAQTSGCSNNLYLQWQPPYINDESESAIEEQQSILIAMSKEIRKFVLDTIVPSHRGFNSHPDSTTGIETVSHTRKTLSKPRPRSTLKQSVLSAEYEKRPSKPSNMPISPDSFDNTSKSSNSSDGGVALDHFIFRRSFAISTILAISSVCVGWVLASYR
ncbi:hypothetical protein TWF730_008936 [Orbilia blumenaviensis]|uniref:Uncharacterized protein n=1 Tax=Orbilia blumenaviensis TaxID=1796055 RepID=A0AAV9UZ89_9PEZI